MNTAEMLERLHQAQGRRDAPPGPPIPEVGGILFDRDADDLLSFMTEVDDQILSLNADVSAQWKGLGHQFSFEGWTSFYQGNAGMFEDGFDPVFVPGATNWRAFFEDSSTWWNRLWRTDELWIATHAYEETFARYYAAFVEAGGVPAKPPPKLGYDTPSQPVGVDDLRDAASSLATIAFIAAGAYLLSQIVALRRSA